MTKNIQPGDRIQTTYGDWYTVIEVRDNIVVVAHFQRHVHISNVVKVAHS